MQFLTERSLAEYKVKANGVHVYVCENQAIQ